MRGRFPMPDLRSQLRSERGVAMPAVLMMLVAGLAMGGVAVTSSIDAQQSSTRDQASKEALAAADAGIQAALYRQNKVVVSDSLPCVVFGLGGDLLAGEATGDGWCPEVEGTVGDASFRYRVKPATVAGTLANEREIRVVSIGTSGELSRRIAVGARARTGQAIFGGADLVGLDSLDIDDASNVTGDAGSNGDVTLGTAASLCGDVTFGYGQGFNQQGTWCSGYGSGEGEFNMPPPLQGNVPPPGNENSNFRMFNGSGCTGAECDTKSGQVGWNPTTRVLTLQGRQTVTLGGSLPYSFCRIDMQGNSSLIAANGATVRIFFDTPENCAATGDTVACDPGPYKQLDVRGNAKLIATSGDPKDFSMLFVGSDSCSTSVVLSGNSSSVNEVVMYGPRTNMQLTGDAQLFGALAGQTSRTDGNSKFTADPDISQFDVEIALQYQRDRYVECVGAAPASPPDANC